MVFSFRHYVENDRSHITQKQINCSNETGCHSEHIHLPNDFRNTEDSSLLRQRRVTFAGECVRGGTGRPARHIETGSWTDRNVRHFCADHNNGPTQRTSTYRGSRDEGWCSVKRNIRSQGGWSKQERYYFTQTYTYILLLFVVVYAMECIWRLIIHVMQTLVHRGSATFGTGQV